MYKFLFISLIITLFTGSVTARIVELIPTKDSGLYSAAAAGNSNRGDGGRFDVGADDSTLIQFDLSTNNINPEETITSATLEIFTASKGPYTYNMTLRAYPVVDSWQEGAGHTSTNGDTGFPWGPTAIGDVCYNYKEITGVATGQVPFDVTLVATSGIPWSVVGCKDIGTDLLDYKMIDALADGRITTAGQPIALMTFTDDGLKVLNAWREETIDNNGLCLFAVNSITNGLRIASRENYTPEIRPRLTLKVNQEATVIFIYGPPL